MNDPFDTTTDCVRLTSFMSYRSFTEMLAAQCWLRRQHLTWMLPARGTLRIG